DGLHSLFRGGGGADHDHEAGDVAGDQGHAQFTDLGVGEVAVVMGALIGGGRAGVLAGLDHLGGDGGAHAGGVDGVGAGRPAHHGLAVLTGGLDVAHGGDLLADVGRDAG